MADQKITNEMLYELLKEFKTDTNRRFDEMQTDTNRRFDEMQTDTNRRFDEMQTDMNQRFEDVNRRFDEIHNQQIEDRNSLRDFKADTRENFHIIQHGLRLDQEKLEKVYQERKKLTIQFGWQWAALSLFIAMISSSMVLAFAG